MTVTRFWHNLRFATHNLWLLPLLGMVACGPQLRATPDATAEKATQIAGNWQMQNADREQLLATLRAALQEADAKQQSRDRREQRNQPPINDGVGMPGDPVAMGMGGMPIGNNWEQRERQEQLESLLLAVVPSRTLRITQQASTQQAGARVELVPESSAIRRFIVGETSTLVTSYDTLTVRSGWQKNDFVVYATGKEQGLKVTERYQRSGDELLVMVTITMSGFKAQTLQARYQKL